VTAFSDVLGNKTKKTLVHTHKQTNKQTQTETNIERPSLKLKHLTQTPVAKHGEELRHPSVEVGDQN